MGGVIRKERHVMNRKEREVKILGKIMEFLIEEDMSKCYSCHATLHEMMNKTGKCLGCKGEPKKVKV